MSLKDYIVERDHNVNAVREPHVNREGPQDQPDEGIGPGA